MDLALKAMLPVAVKIVKLVLPKIKEAIDKAPNLPADTTRALQVIQLTGNHNKYKFLIMVNEINPMNLEIKETKFKKILDLENDDIDKLITEITDKL